MPGSNPSGLAVECTRQDLHVIHGRHPINPGYGKQESASFGTGACKLLLELGRTWPTSSIRSVLAAWNTKKYHPFWMEKQEKTE